MFAAAFHPRTMRQDAALGWRRVAHVQRVYTNEDGSTCRFATNRHGWRGPAPESARVPGRARVLVLGDSFTEGGQVDDADLFTTRLAAQVPGVEVVNAGVGGFGTVQEYLLLRDEGLALAPDLVLVVVYDNDWIDNCLSYSPAIGPRPYAVASADSVQIVEDYDDADFLAFCLPFPGQSFLARHSYVYRSVNDKLYQPLRGSVLQERARSAEARFDEGTRRRVLLTLLDRMRALAEGGGARLAVVLAPRREAAAAGADRRHDDVAAHLATTATPCVDLLPALHAAMSRGESPYFERDIHWTRAGHASVAAALAPLVRAQLELR